MGGGYGGTLGVHVLPTTVIEIDAYQARSLVFVHATSSAALRVQQFIGRRLYLRAGARYRLLELRADVDGTDDYERRTTQLDLGVDAAVGFRWDLSHMVLGVDAVGVYAPLTAYYSKEQTVDRTNGEVLDEAERGWRARWDFRAGYLYVGVRL